MHVCYTLRASHKKGGPCGLCSRRLPLDKRALLLNKLTDLKVDAGVGVAPTMTGL